MYLLQKSREKNYKKKIEQSLAHDYYLINVPIIKEQAKSKKLQKYSHIFYLTGSSYWLKYFVTVDLW